LRIIQALAGAKHGGAEGFFERLTVAMQEAGVEQKVLIRNNKERAKLLSSQNCDVVELPFGGSFDLVTKYKFSKIIKEYKPDIVLTWMNRATDKCPKANGNFIHIARLGGYYNLKYYQKCDELIGNTEDLVKYMADNGWDKNHAHYVPNFVEEKQGNPIAKSEFGIPEDAKMLLSLGRLHVNKAFDTLIKALKETENTYLCLAGVGPLEDELKALADSLGLASRVKFLGWRSDTADLISSCDIFVCPSRHETLGNVVLEAWAQGKPIVATASEGPSQLIESGKDGILTPIDDVPALAEAINNMIADSDNTHRIAKVGKAKYDANFNKSAVVKKFIYLFATLIEAKK